MAMKQKSYCGKGKLMESYCEKLLKSYCQLKVKLMESYCGKGKVFVLRQRQSYCEKLLRGKGRVIVKSYC